MKKAFGIAAFVLLLGLVVYGVGKLPAETVSAEAATQTAAVESAALSDGKTLVVYFSRSGENWNVGTVEKGSTQLAAEYIAAQLGADLYRIEPTTPYPDNYMEMLGVASEEQKADVRPEIKNAVDNWKQYDTVYLGYPIWDGDMPMIVYSFLESYDFAGKTVYPFDTHAGSGLAGTVHTIREKAQGADVKEGLALSGETVQKNFDKAAKSIEEWLD